MNGGERSIATGPLAIRSAFGASLQAACARKRKSVGYGVPIHPGYH